MELSNGGMALVVQAGEEAVVLDANNMLAGEEEGPGLPRMHAGCERTSRPKPHAACCPAGDAVIINVSARPWPALQA